MTSAEKGSSQLQRGDLLKLRAFAVLLPVAALAMFCAGTAAESRDPAEVPPHHVPAALSSVSPHALDATEPALIGPSPAPARLPGPPAMGNGSQLRLPRWATALAGLSGSQRVEPVRMVWLGDSHTAADFMTGRVRARLQATFGAGGPGFVRWGSPVHRHDAASTMRSGKFLMEPISLPRRSKHGDGLFGFYGLRVSPQSWPATLGLQVSPSSVSETARFSVLYEPRGKSSFTLKLGARSVQVRDGKLQHATVGVLPAPSVTGSSIERVQLLGRSTDTLSLEVQTGKPRFHGVIVEGERPGLVLDTVGIDGARLATVLAWDEDSFVAELAARRPDLVVVAFGTNEAFDKLRVSAYDAELSSVLGRVQRAAPQSDCLVLGPPDVLEVSGLSVERVPEIAAVYAQVSERLGCGFVSLQTLMGGPGSFATWQRLEPRFAQPDRIHLTKEGYRELGERLSSVLLGAARPSLATNSW